MQRVSKCRLSCFPLCSMIFQLYEPCHAKRALSVFFIPLVWKVHRGHLVFGSSVCLSVHLSVRLSVTKTLTWLISSEVLMIEHWYLACMILVTSPFYWCNAVTLNFDLLQGQICCRTGDHNSSNLLVLIHSVCFDNLYWPRQTHLRT